MSAPLPEGPFACILADPPWSFKTYSGKSVTPHRSAEDHYVTTPTAVLCQIPVKAVVAKDAALFMWVTSSHIPDAIELAEAWGFKFKTIAFIWVKTPANKGQMGFFPADPAYRIGMGYWTRQQGEICLLFTRGKPKRLSMAVRQIIAAPRREHSRKPDDTHARIQALVAGPYLEMFAREPRPGWTVWGNQTDKFENAA
jgi:N6-adenosine-specific RNA methylase IME4